MVIFKLFNYIIRDVDKQQFDYLDNEPQAEPQLLTVPDSEFVNLVEMVKSGDLDKQTALTYSLSPEQRAIIENVS